MASGRSESIRACFPIPHNSSVATMSPAMDVSSLSTSNKGAEI